MGVHLQHVVSAAVLVLIVMASATQTELANYVTAQKGYNKPYMTFYFTHSFFSFIFPIHVVCLKIARPKVRTGQYIGSLRLVMAKQLGVEHGSWTDIRGKLIWTLLKLTTLISIPSISWFAAVSMTGVTDITSIYASATFFTYGFSLLLLHTPLSKVTVSAIVIAFLGVIVITFSGLESDDAEKSIEQAPEPSHRILGDLIMLFGAAVLGYYEVVYKMALPEGHGGADAVDKENESGLLPVGVYHTVPDAGAPSPSSPFPKRLPHSRSRNSLTPLYRARSASSASITHKLPLALHANFLTSLIGLTTFTVFWLPLPFLHWMGIEHFRVPWGLWSSMLGIFLSGATYNAGFMCLIGFLGPVTASVANLLAIGLVTLVDAVWLGRSIPTWTLVGACLVGLGFGVLLWEGEGEVLSDEEEMIDDTFEEEEEEEEEEHENLASRSSS